MRKIFKHIAVYALVITALAACFGANEAKAWDSAGWDHYNNVIISQLMVEGTADLTYFPVLIKLDSHQGLASYAQSDGDDIVFTSQGGATKLSHEIEYFNPDTGELIAWVKVPLLSATLDTTLRMYYGNASASNQENVIDVWSNGFSMVYHFAESVGTTGAGSVFDSTANTSSTPSSGIEFGDSGQIGSAPNFSSGTGISAGTIGSPLLQAETTISFWMNSANFASPARQNPFDQAYGGWGTMTLETSGAISWYMGSNGGNGSPYSNYSSSGAVASNGSWVYVTVTRNPTGYVYTWYKNGDLNRTGTYDSSYPVIASRTFTIGDGYVYPFNGRIDEFRVINDVRSAEWIKTEYNNQSNPGYGDYVIVEGEGDIIPDIETGLLAHWEFEGNTEDSSIAGGYDGTVTGGAEYSASQPEGRYFGQAFTFNGSNYMTFSSMTFPDNGFYTIAFWARPNDQPACCGGTVGAADDWNDSILLTANEQFTFYDNNNSHFYGPDLSPSQWGHLALVADGGTFTWYYNGQYFDSTNARNEYILIDRLAGGYGTTRFPGLMDEVRVYNRALSATDVQALYDYTPFPVANDDIYSTDQDVQLVVSAPGVLSNDTDGDPLIAIKVSDPSHGTLDSFNADGSFAYTPDAGYTGSDSFSYKANDGMDDSNIATVNITVWGCPEISSDGLVGYWQFNDNLFDFAGSNHGSFGGDPQYVNSYQGLGKALDFDGVDDYVDLGTSDDLKLQYPMSISAWVNVSAFQYGSVMARDTSDGREFEFRDNGADKICLTIYPNGTSDGQEAVCPSSSLPSGSWHHIAVTIDAGRNVSFYKDGNPDGSGVFANSNIPTATIMTAIGEGTYGDYNFNGLIDDVRFYNRELTPSEVADLAVWSSSCTALEAALQSNPSTGQTPLTVDLTANVFGSETGDIHYYFWCNCNNDSTDLVTIQNQCGGANADISNGTNPQTVANACTYTVSGDKTAKVLVERGASQAEGRTNINAYSYSAGGLWGQYLDDTYEKEQEYSTLYTQAMIENINFDNFDATLQTRVGQSNDTTTYWKGSIYAAVAGTYNFHVLVSGIGSHMFGLNIGNRGVSCDTGSEINVFTSNGTINSNSNVYLSAGWHNIRIEFLVYSGATDTTVKLFWTPPGGTEEIVPASVLSPEAASDKIIAIPDISKPKEKIDYVIAGTGGRVANVNLDSNLLGHWKMDEIVDGDDVANSGFYCQYPGDTQYMSFPEDLVPGKLGNALDFDGANDYVNVTSSSYYSANDSNARTISAWFKASAQADDGHILWKEGGCKGWWVRLGTDGKVALNLGIENVAGAGCSNHTDYTITAGDADYADGAWHHVLAVIDRTTGNDYMKLFIDGAQKGATIALQASGSSSGGTLRFASDYNGGSGSYKGLIDDVRIYGRVLNSEEISILALAGSQPANPLNIVMDLTAKGIDLDDVLTDEVYMFAMYESDETGHRVKNNLTGAEEWITAERFISSTGWPISYITAKLPQSLFNGQADKTKIDLEFNLDDGQFRNNGIVLLVPHIKESATYTARLYIRATGEGLYRLASSVYVFPVDFSEKLTTDDIRPFFVFGDGETMRTMPGSYRSNYMFYVSGNMDAGEYPPGEFEIIQNMPGAIRMVPRDNGPPSLANSYSWYPAFGREGAQLDIVSQNYLENQAAGVTTGGGEIDIFSIPEEDNWIAFQGYGLNFPGDNVLGSGESMSMFGGGLVSVEPIMEVPLPEVPTGVNASSTLCETANISWNDGTYEDYYVIQRKYGEFDFATITPSQIPQNTTFFQDTSLGNIEYTYRVRACNDNDICSGWSSPVSVTPESCVPPGYFTLQSSNSIEVNLSGNVGDIETSTETTISVTPFLGFTNDISLSFYSITDNIDTNPLYPGITWNFSTNPLVESDGSYSTSQFSVTMPGNVPPGVYVIRLNGDGVTYSAGVSVTLYVNAIAPDWKEF